MDLVRTFEDHPVRMHVEDGEPWFCLADLGRVLDLVKPSDFVRSRACDVEGVRKLLTPSSGGTQEAYFVDEGNLYTLIMRSSKPEAIAFRRWVTREVLPEIRKTGSYAPTPTDPVLGILDALGAVRRDQLATLERVDSLEQRLTQIS
jgi:anti-repressor protein